MALVEANPKLVAITTDVEHFFDDGTIDATARLQRDPRLLPLLLTFTNVIGGHGQMIYSREAYHKVGGYDPDYNYAEDYDLWTRLADVGPFASVPETLYRYRKGHDSISSLNDTKQESVSRRIGRRQFEKLTGVPMDAPLSLGLRSYWRRAAPEDTSIEVTWRTTSALLQVANAFFESHPELRHEKFETLRRLSARWWWRLTQSNFATFSPILRLVYFATAVRLRLAAGAAKARYGDGHKVIG